MKRTLVKDETFRERENGFFIIVEVWKQFDRYEITINGTFYCTCENLNEVDSEIDDIKNEYDLMCA